MADYERIEERSRMLDIADRARREMMAALQQNFVGRPMTERLIQEITAFLRPFQDRLQTLLADPSVRVDVRPNPADPYEVYVDVSRDPGAWAGPPKYLVVFVQR